MKSKTEIEELVYVKTSWLEDKEFVVFANEKGELRVVESIIVDIPEFLPGIKVKAIVRKKGCSSMEIEKIFLS